MNKVGKEIMIVVGDKITLVQKERTYLIVAQNQENKRHKATFQLDIEKDTEKKELKLISSKYPSSKINDVMLDIINNLEFIIEEI